MNISLRRASAFLDASSPEDDFDVMAGESRIGRVYSDRFSALPWRWSLSQLIAPGNSGKAATRPEALAALALAYDKVLSGDDTSATPQRSLRATLLMQGETC